MRTLLVVPLLCLLPVACAHRAPVTEPPVAATQSLPTPQDPNDPSFLTLDQIKPVPTLPATRPASSTRPAPLDALQWFAQARNALASGQRQTAINLLEKAVRLDPNSPELWEELARAYGASDKSVAAYEKAIALDPHNLSLHEKLGRHLLIKSKPEAALEHFRLAMQTDEYKDDNESAAVVDFFLARCLQRLGYDRAALDAYATLVKRLDRPAFTLRSNPELMSLLSQPEILYGQIGELYEKHKQYDEAVKAYELAAERATDNFDLQARLTRSLADAGRGEEAAKRAQELVTRFRANPDSLKLLHDVYRKLNREADVVNVLAALHKERPNDPSILFALADAMVKADRAPEAESLLLGAAKARPDSSAEIIRRLFDMYEDRDDVEKAVRLLVNALAANPDSLRQLSPLWSDLLKPSRRNRLRLPLLQKLQVAPEAEASRLFWVSRVADLWNRDALARSALEQGAQIKPPFPPIMRALLADYWARPDWDDNQKIQTARKLADNAREQANPALAAELEGLSLLRQKGKSEEAADKLAQSIKLGNKAPDVQLTQAMALRVSGHGARAESLLWKIISDTPTYEDAYMELFSYYFQDNQPSKAINVLSKWLSTDPGNVNARLLRARIMKQAGRPEAAESELLALFSDQPDNAQILGSLYEFYTDARRLDEYLGKLEEFRKKHPEAREVAEQLALIYHEQKRLPEALRVLDATRDAVRNDPDLLYYIAHVYGRIDQKKTEEQLLEAVVQLDPRHASASNDLGYSWADEGRNLQRAEELIRVAVEAEPDNQSFLDSLGWVLYKRSKFAEARVYFEKAIGPATRPDPVVLDHMGDVLYRLSFPDLAASQWRRAQQRLEDIYSDREDLKKLRLQLMQKLRQHQNSQPVDVAPVAEEPKPATQAKN